MRGGNGEGGEEWGERGDGTRVGKGERGEGMRVGKGKGETERPQPCEKPIPCPQN